MIKFNVHQNLDFSTIIVEGLRNEKKLVFIHTHTLVYMYINIRVYACTREENTGNKKKETNERS